MEKQCQSNKEPCGGGDCVGDRNLFKEDWSRSPKRASGVVSPRVGRLLPVFSPLSFAPQKDRGYYFLMLTFCHFFHHRFFTKTLTELPWQSTDVVDVRVHGCGLF